MSKLELRLRPEVRRFAEAMERQLRKHDRDKGSDGWKGEHEYDLLKRADEEMTELREVMLGYACSCCRHQVKKRALPDAERTKRIEAEAADVANMLMMTVDVACWSDS